MMSRLIAYLLCAIGCILQCWEIIELYLTYPSTYETKIFDRDHIMLPAIVICPTYSGSRIGQLFPEVEEQFLAKNGSDRSAFYTARQWYESAYNESDFFIDCTIRLPNQSVVPCIEVSRIRTYFAYNEKCFGLFEQRQIILKPEEMIYGKEFEGQTILKVIGNTDSYLFQKWMHVSIYPNDEYPQLVHGYTGLANFLLESVRKVMFTYSKSSFHLLEYPYKGNCRDFFKARTIELCALERFETKYNAWPNDVIVTRHQVIENDEIKFINKDAAKQRVACNADLTHSQCDDNQLIIKPQTYQYTLNMSDTFVFEFALTGEAETRVEEEVRISMESLFSYIANLVSSWLGICFYELIDEMLFAGWTVVAKVCCSSRARCSYRGDDRFNLSRPGASIIIGIYLFGIVMSVYQSIDVIDAYMRNPFTTEFLIAKPESIELPQLSICLEPEVVPEKLKDLYPKYYSPYITWDEALSTFTVSDLLKLTLNASEVLVECTLRKPNLKLIKCSEWSDVKVQLNEGRKCFTWFCDHHRKTNGSTNTVYVPANLVNQFWVRIVFHPLKGSNIGVTIHPTEWYSTDLGHPSTIEIDVNTLTSSRIFNNYGISFAKASLERISDHRASNCRDYEELAGYSSQREVIDACVLNFSLAQIKAWPGGVFSEENDERADNAHFMFRDLTEWSREKAIREKCNAIHSKPNCHEEEFMVLLQEQRSYNSKEVRVKLEVPMISEVLLSEAILMDFIEVVSQLAGIIGMWLGFDFYSFTYGIMSVFKLVFGKRSHRHRTQLRARLRPARPIALSSETKNSKRRVHRKPFDPDRVRTKSNYDPLRGNPNFVEVNVGGEEGEDSNVRFVYVIYR